MPTVKDIIRLGVSHHLAGNLPQAEAYYRQALQADPNSAEARHQLGLIAHQTGHNDAAAELIRGAIALYPFSADFHSNLGIVFMQLGQPAEATRCYRDALRLDPDHVNALINLAESLKKQGELDEALVHCRHALALAPDNASAHNVEGGILFNQGMFAQAAAHFDEALRLAPGLTAAHSNRALLRLLTGDFEKGWQDYEHRRNLASACTYRFTQPLWNGEPLAGRTIFVYVEQGLGDTIHFVRYAPKLKELGATVLFMCQPELEGLLHGVAGVDQVVPANALLPPFDFRVPLLSLPGIFRATSANVPAAVPYLHADANLVHHFRRELAGAKGFKIGIAWQGNPSHEGDAFRSFPLAHFEGLSKLDGVSLISVQVGAGQQQLESVRFPVVNLGRSFDPKSLADLAAALRNMDLVVTVDSAVAHLAGALGVKVWTLLPCVPDWRWLLEREDTPWYPTMRLVRQRRLGDWDEVFTRIVADVSTLTAQ